MSEPCDHTCCQSGQWDHHDHDAAPDDCVGCITVAALARTDSAWAEFARFRREVRGDV